MKIFSFNLLGFIASFILLCVVAGCTANRANIEAERNTLSGGELGSKSIVIEHINVIDVENGLRPDMTVVIRGGEIVDVARSVSRRSSDGTRTINGRGKYLIPGLWDSHVHITFTPELESSMFSLFLANGVTSVRDTGGKLDAVLAWREKARASLSPDVYVAGPLIDGVPSVYNGQVEGFPDISETVITAQDAKRLVDELAKADVDLIKSYEMLTPEAFTALVKRAKYHNLPVTGHVPLSMSTPTASAAGLNSIEHMRNLEMDCSAESEQLLKERQAALRTGKATPGSKLRAHIHAEQHFRSIKNLDVERCKRVLEILAKNNTWQVPTLTLTTASRTGFYADDQWRSTFEYLPEPIRSRWLETTGRYKKVLEKPSPAREKRAKISDWKRSIIPQLLRANVRIMAGTDSPIFFLTPGFSLHKELETLVDAGMSPIQAIDSVTLAPAEYFGLQENQGLIQKNYVADLVILDENPLEDIRNTKKIHMVIKRGIVLERSDLDQLLKPKIH